MVIRPCITFPQAPLRSRTVGSPESGSDLGLALTAFPVQRKLKCWSIYTPHPIGLQVSLDLFPGSGSSVASGSVSGLRRLQTRQVPRAPLHGSRCYLSRQGVLHPVSRRDSAFIALTGYAPILNPPPASGLPGSLGITVGYPNISSCTASAAPARHPSCYLA